MGSREPDSPPEDGDSQELVITKPVTKVQPPSLYKVLLHNDDYTPMDFVVMVLEQYFNKEHAEATRLMLAVHEQGLAICGIFTFEVAETKVAQVREISREHQHPLQCTMEKA